MPRRLTAARAEDRAAACSRCSSRRRPRPSAVFRVGSLSTASYLNLKFVPSITLHSLNRRNIAFFL